jgi:hypothetical protein
MTIIKGNDSSGREIVVECADGCPPILDPPPRWQCSSWFKVDGKPATMEKAQEALYSMTKNIISVWDTADIR